MKRRLNVKMLGMVVCVLIVAVAGIFGAVRFRSSQIASGLLAAARASEEKGALKDALGWYDAYLARTPSDTAVLEHFARLCLKTALTNAEIQQAHNLLSQALSRQPEDHDLRLTVARAAVALGRDTDARRHLAYLQKAAGADPQQQRDLVRVLRQLARAPRDRYEVFLYYEQILRTQPDEAALRREAVELALELGLFSDALPHLETLTASVTDGSTKSKPQDNPETLDAQAELAALMAKCQDGLKAYDAAALWWERALRGTPRVLGYYDRLARLYQTYLKRPERAARVLEEMVAASGASHEGYLLRAKFRGEFQLPGVDEDLQRAREIAPTDAEVLLAVADRHIRRLQEADAVAALEAGMKSHPKDPRFYQIRAKLAVAREDWDKALLVLKNGIDSTDGNPNLHWMRADLLIQQGRIDDARESRDFLKSVNYSPDLRDLPEARILVSQRQWQSAREILDRIIPALESEPEIQAQAWLLMGRCQEGRGESDKAEVSYRQILDKFPVHPAGVRALARLLVPLGRIDETVAMYQRLDRRTLADMMLLTRLHMARALRETTPVWTEAERSLQAAIAMFPKDLEPRLAEAELRLVQNRREEAVQLAERLRTAHPQRAEPIVLLAELARTQGDRAAARTLLSEPRFQKPMPAVLYRAWLRWAWDAPVGEAVAFLNGMTKTLPDLAADADADALRQETATLLQILGDYRGARAQWQTLARDRPGDLAVRSALFDLALVLDEPKLWDQHVDELRTIEGDEGGVWRFARAALLWETVRRNAVAKNSSPSAGTAAAGSAPDASALLEEARLMLREASARRPRWSRIPLLEGEIANFLGDEDQALDGFLKAINLGDRQADVIRRAAVWLLMRKRANEAGELIARLQESGPLPNDMSRLAAEAAGQANRPKEAMAIAKRTVSANSTDAKDFLWLGAMQQRAGNTAEAEAAFRKAARLAPLSRDMWWNLARFYRETGQTPRALLALTEAKTQLEPLDAQMLAAEWELLEERPERAEPLFQALLNQIAGQAVGETTRAVSDRVCEYFVQSGKLDDVAAVLKAKMAEGQPPADQARAKRLYALGLAYRNDPRAALAALAMLGDPASASQSSGVSGRDTAVFREEQRIRALALATLPDQRAAALRIFRDLARTTQFSVHEERIFCGLLESDRAWPEAYARLRERMAQRPGPVNLLLVKTYLNGVLRQSRARDPGVAEAVAELQKRAPTDPETWSLTAHWLRATGQSAAVPAKLRTLIPSMPPSAAWARVLEDQGLIPEAGAVFQAQVNARTPSATNANANASALLAESLLDQADFFLRQGKLDAAAGQLLDPRTAAFPNAPARLSESLGVLITTSQFPRAEVDRVADVLEERLAADVKNAPLRHALALARDRQDRPEDAERCYRQILQAQPDDLLAKNNLAWLLAVRGGDHAAMSRLIQESILLAGAQAQFLDTRGLIALLHNNPEAALADFKAAWAQRHSAGLAFHLALAQHAQGQRVDAKQTLKIARELGFTPNAIHPRERAACATLIQELLENPD